MAATIFPAQSEIGLAALILSQDYSVVLLIGVASIGNTLGIRTKTDDDGQLRIEPLLSRKKANGAV